MMADLMFRKQNYEAAVNLYHQVLERAPGSCLPRDCPARLLCPFPPSEGYSPEEGGPSTLLPDRAEEAPSSLIVPRAAGN